MRLENFELITRDDWPEMQQCILQFDDIYFLSIMKEKSTGTYEIEFEKSGYILNPFDNTCSGTITNISVEKINHYIFLLTILTGSHPTQV